MLGKGASAVMLLEGAEGDGRGLTEHLLLCTGCGVQRSEPFLRGGSRQLTVLDSCNLDLPCGGGTNRYLPRMHKGEVTRELVLAATCQSPLPCLGR